MIEGTPNSSVSDVLLTRVQLALALGVAENGGFDAGGWGDYADAVAGKNGAVLFAGCVAGVEGEGKDE
jgi:hypothetical protein